MRPPADAMFAVDGDTFVPTLRTQGPWDPGAQFGGSPAALLATLVEDTATLVPMQVARFTLDLLRPVPIAPLTAGVQVVREGKRIQVVSASLFAGGTEWARCSALRMRKVDIGRGPWADGLHPVPLPDAPRATDEEPFQRDPPGSRGAVEYLFEGTGGHFRDPTWVRLKVAVLAGRPLSPLARLAYTADLASGIGHVTGTPLVGINADLALNVVRYPRGEWLCLQGRGWTSEAGIGQVQATLSDTSGVAAAVSMARLVDLVVP